MYNCRDKKFIFVFGPERKGYRMRRKSEKVAFMLVLIALLSGCFLVVSGEKTGTVRLLLDAGIPAYSFLGN